MGFALVVLLFFNSCSSDDPFDFSLDPTCGRNISFIIEVSPEGTGNVSKSEFVYSEGLDGLMPTQVVEFFATPKEGYQFKKWDLDPITDKIENPFSLVPCKMSSTIKTVRVTAMFEKIED